jgi:hypothetical protein
MKSIHRAFGYLLLLLACSFSAQAHAWAQARFVHAAPISADSAQTAISLYIAGDFSSNDFPHSYELHNIRYRNYTSFFGYPAADFAVEIRSGVNGTRLVETTITLQSDHAHWIILTGDGEHQDYEIHLLSTVLPAWDSGQHALPILHAAPVPAGSRAETLALSLPSGEPLDPVQPELVYGQAAEDLRVEPGELQFVVHSPDQAVEPSQAMTLDLDPLDQGTAIVIIGDGSKQPVSLLAIPGGELALPALEDQAPAAGVDNSVLGWWDTPNTDAAEGLLLQPLPDEQRLVGTLYTYADDDSGAQRWYVLDSCRPDQGGSEMCPDQAGFDGRHARATLLAAEGARLGGSEPAELRVVGTLEVLFDDCTRGQAWLSLDDGATVHWELDRLTRTVDCSLDSD